MHCIQVHTRRSHTHTITHNHMHRVHPIRLMHFYFCNFIIKKLLAASDLYIFFYTYDIYNIVRIQTETVRNSQFGRGSFVIFYFYIVGCLHPNAIRWRRKKSYYWKDFVSKTIVIQIVFSHTPPSYTIISIHICPPRTHTHARTPQIK